MGNGRSLFCVLLIYLCGSGCQPQGEVPALENYEFGGDFELLDQRGQPFALQDLRGAAALLFFGYSFCPDICPVTLSKLAQVGELLGPGKRLKILFISVDPQRDTPRQLEEYLSYFDAGIIGLTGREDDVQAVISQYAGSYQRGEADEAGGYLISHPARTYLIDQQGRVRYLFSQEDTPERMAAIAGELF